MMIFSGTSSRLLAQKTAKKLNLSLSSLSIHFFPDGEKRVRIEENVLDQDTIIIESTATPVDENYMEFFLIADALKRSGAKRVTAVVPYMGYQRQDHIFVSGEGVSFGVIAKLAQAVGIDKIINFDPHSIKIPEFFSIPFTPLSALPIFAEKIKEKKWNKNNTVLVSPDMGGIRRIKILSSLLNNMPYATIEKERDLSTGEVSVSGSKGLDGYDKAIIVDDMISSGGTIAISSDFLKEKGVKEIYVFATHPVFSDESKKILQKSSVEKVFVTDTVQIPEDKKFPKLEILSVVPMIAEELKKQ
ncbi:MAG: ribose-phosphate pyrophosphokinase [Candidatus Levybacteria bacterium]|nr:ribose-phosphate pyrophosphokinase [Candidatus Levybacteria bacterium]